MEFYLLVLTNAALLSWNSFVQDNAFKPQEPVYTKPVSKSILLLSEPLSSGEVAGKQAQIQTR